MKHFAVFVTFDAVEYPVVDITVDVALKTVLAKFNVIPDILGFTVEGEILKKVACTIILNHASTQLFEVDLATDYKTTMDITLHLLTYVFGIKIERTAPLQIAVTLNILGHQLIVDKIVVDTDFLTTLTMKTEVNHQVYGWKIERHGHKVAVVLLVQGKELSLADLTLDTDFKQKIALI